MTLVVFSWKVQFCIEWYAGFVIRKGATGATTPVDVGREAQDIIHNQGCSDRPA